MADRSNLFLAYTGDVRGGETDVVEFVPPEGVTSVIVGLEVVQRNVEVIYYLTDAVGRVLPDTYTVKRPQEAATLAWESVHDGLTSGATYLLKIVPAADVSYTVYLRTPPLEPA
jgi:hypothetical protein